jgi:hypothetical protein
MRKLNLGAGDCPLEGYENWDRKTGQEVYPLTGVPDASVDEIRASHILEHFSHQDVMAVITEWARALKPGGVLKIAVPNLAYIVDKYQKGNPDGEPLMGYLFGGHVDENDKHGTAMDEGLLKQCLEDAGLRDVKRWESEVKDCAALPVSLNLQGTKGKPRLNIPKTVGIMSAPRLGFLDTMFCVTQHLVSLGIPVSKVSGAFWGQCLERGMEAAIAEGAEWILTLDYDTKFTREAVVQLLKLMAQHPEADAIAPLQMKRADEHALLCIMGENGKPRGELGTDELESSPLLKVTTAHFGLTLLRVSALMKLRHPWFLGVPNELGRWDEGRVDDDIYFWKKWAEAGNSLYVAHRVPVGHLQLMETWPAEDLTPIHTYVTHYDKGGAPEGVRK